jgi:KUP system potassium uptake protein
MERPDVPDLLRLARDRYGCALQFEDVTYYVGLETVVGRQDGKGLPAWEEIFFAMMERNAVHVTDFFPLPPDSVVEIGRQVAI